MARLPDPQLAQKRRRQILDAALVCFCRRGFHQATMQEICAAAGLSSGALYRYFRSKTDLISAIAEEDRLAVLDALEVCGAEGDFAAGLVALSKSWLTRIAQKDRSLILEVMAEAARDADLRAKLATVQGPLHDALVTWVRRGQKRREVDASIDAEQASRIILAALDGVALRVVLLENGSVEQGLLDLSFVFGRIFSPAARSAKAERAIRGVMEPVG